MSEELSDASEIFAKMQELQRSIEDSKKSLNANKAKPIPASYNNRYASPVGYYQPRGRGGYRGSYRGSWSSYRGSIRKPYRNMTLVMNNNNKSDGIEGVEKESDSNNKDEFISKVSKNGLSLVNTKVYKSDQERQIEKSRKILQLKIDKLLHAKKLKIQQKLQELSVKYDYCNRALINGIEMAIVNGNIRLVPISYIEDENYKNIVEFEGYKYSKLGDGSYLQQDHDESELPR